jgi:hypothetical protein
MHPHQPNKLISSIDHLRCAFIFESVILVAATIWYLNAQLCSYQLEQEILEFCQGLRALGVDPDDKLALFADNSCRWLVADQGNTTYCFDMFNMCCDENETSLCISILITSVLVAVIVKYHLSCLFCFHIPIPFCIRITMNLG